MRRLLVVSSMVFVWIGFLVTASFAAENAPTPTPPNNKFGIHLAVPSREDEQSAAKLINSNGGSWGYVTLVIQDNDRDVGKWQETFDNLRRLRLIPIIRIATHPDGAAWKVPQKTDADEWVHFLQSLRWVVKERYVILFNEPNHGAEWGGKTDPQAYAEVSNAFAQALHKASDEYVVMLAGLDAAAPQQPPQYMDEAEYLRQVFEKEPKLLEQIGALSSHSYPNPGFSASPANTGRTSIRGYEWELSLLSELGLDRDIPVFITETGWARDRLTPATVADYFRQAYAQWLSDGRVQAVTPFLLNYQGDPFLSFSWQMPNAQEFYPQYDAVRSMGKVAGRPAQDQSGALQAQIPRSVFVASTYTFPIRVKNTGQAIWDREDGYSLRLRSQGTGYRYFFDDIDDIEPLQTKEVDLHIHSGYEEGAQQWRVELVRDDGVVLSRSWNVRVLPLPTLDVRVGLFPRIRSKQDREFELQLFDENERLVYKEQGLKRDGGVVHLDRVKNVYVGGRYRIVVLSKQYLPRQTYVTITEKENIVTMRPMLPLDFNQDGHFSLWDIWELVKHPQYLGYFLP